MKERQLPFKKRVEITAEVVGQYQNLPDFDKIAPLVQKLISYREQLQQIQGQYEQKPNELRWQIQSNFAKLLFSLAGLATSLGIGYSFLAKKIRPFKKTGFLNNY